MKFLFIVPRYHTNQYFWSKTLIDNGHTVRYFVLSTYTVEWYDVLDPIELPHSPIVGSEAFQFSELYREMKAYAPDVVISRGFKWYTFQAFFAARLLGIKSLLYNQAPKFTTTKPRQLLLRALRMVRLAPSLRITPVRGEGKYDDTSARYVPFVADFPFTIHEKEYMRSGAVHIVSVGKLDVARKNLGLFLKAVRRIKNSYPVMATIAGGSKEGSIPQALLDQINELGLEEIVTVRQNLSQNEMVDLYKKSDLFVLPSSNEPAAFSLLEAMNFALPVICSDTNGTRCYIKEGENGYIFKSNDAEDLASKIEGIISERDTIERMGKKSFELVKDKHAPHRFVEQMEKIIDQV